MTNTFATKTTVSVDKTKAEIEATLRRWGASGFMSAWEGENNVIAFKYKGLEARINLMMPDRNSKAITMTPTTMHYRSDADQEKVYAQAKRTRWRELLLYIKASLAGVDAGIISFEQAFLPHFVLPNGRTVTDSLMPEIYRALEAGELPAMLGAGQ